MKILAALLPLAASAAWGAEMVELSTGRTIRADRLERHGSIVRLVTSTGVIELDAAMVLAVEPLPPDPEPLAVPAVQAVSTPLPQPAVPPRQLVDEAADRYGIPREFLHSVARTESAYRQDAVSPKGAIGIMQLMPQTAAALGADPTDAAQNVDAGARHLRELLERYDGSATTAAAAYNAGEGAVQKYGGVPPYRETQDYVRRVVTRYRQAAGTAASAPDKGF